MSTALTGQWFRIAQLTPLLRAHAQVHRHVARGQVWYVVQDHQTGRFFRISPAANLILHLMDGRRTMADIWQRVCARLGADQPTRDDAVRLLIQLHQADLLRTDLPPDMTELGRRADRHMKTRRQSWITSPMALRLKLFDPDALLTAAMPWLRPFFTRAAFLLWLALVASGVLLAVLNWPELTDNVSDRVFTTYNVLMLLLLYPASKALHELGHAFAVKAGGGEVHEIGLMLLVFFPVPYVDATAASAFPERWRRMLVGAAGIMVELALAALAMIAWTRLDPGLFRAAAFNLALLGSISTVLFNGNPLLRFDGYYVLGDWLEIHNLDQRSRRYLLYLMQRFLFGLRDTASPIQAPGEAKYLAGYAISAFIYRIGVALGIAALVSQRFFAIGIILAAVSLAQMMVLPVLRGLRYLATSPALRRARPRAWAICGGAFALVAALLLIVPIPHAVLAEGVVWVPEDAIVRARADGFVAGLTAAPDSAVISGQSVIALEDPVSESQIAVYRAERALAASRYEAVNLIDLVSARLAAEQLRRADAVLDRAESRGRDLVIPAQREGRLVIPDAAHLPGRFVHNGDILGYVIGPGDIVVRAVVPQAEIDLVRGDIRAASIRFTETIDQERRATILRVTPSALDRAPTAALSPDGGGPMLLDPTSPRHDRPLDRWYEVVLRAEGTVAERIGGRAYVRFNLGAEPVVIRLWRAGRQALLAALNV